MSEKNGTEPTAVVDAPTGPTPQQVSNAQAAVTEKAFAKVGELVVVNQMLTEQLARSEANVELLQRDLSKERASS